MTDVVLRSFRTLLPHAVTATVSAAGDSGSGHQIYIYVQHA